ncbi:cysteine hydrolase [Clostridium sp. AF15-17LB]|nr:cysteine hydrolase [Clostridium sp. AF15-17LB]
MRILVVVDMQNDFVDGALGTEEAVGIVPAVAERIRSFDGRVLYTQDTHESDYLKTLEGKKLPVPHCIRGTEGWELCPQIKALCKEVPIDKPAFGSVELGRMLKEYDSREKVESVTFAGLCTDICVISNAMIVKAFLPETEVIVDAACCAGVTPESHRQALEAMKVCQIKVLDE